MTTLLARNATVLVTMDDDRREIAGGGIYAEDGFIVVVGTNDELPATADDVIDLTGHVVMPGLVNTHHHLYQNVHSRRSRRSGRGTLRLATHALSDMGAHDGRAHPGLDRETREISLASMGGAPFSFASFERAVWIDLTIESG